MLHLADDGDASGRWHIPFKPVLGFLEIASHPVPWCEGLAVDLLNFHGPDGRINNGRESHVSVSKRCASNGLLVFYCIATDCRR